MAAAADKFARLAALKPTRPLPARPAAIRTPGEEDVLGRLLGAGVASNPVGEQLAVRNWFSTPEFSEPSSTTLELLSRTRDESIARKTRAALEDPEKWLFLDTETTGLAGGTGTYAFLIGLAWWDAGGLQVEQFFMRDFAEEHSLLHELAARVAERPVLVTFNGKSFDSPLREYRFTTLSGSPARATPRAAPTRAPVLPGRLAAQAGSKPSTSSSVRAFSSAGAVRSAHMPPALRPAKWGGLPSFALGRTANWR